MSTTDDRRQARVPPQGAGSRLDRFLQESFPLYSRRQIGRVLRSGLVRVNGAAARPGTVLAEGDLLDLPVMSEAVREIERGTEARSRLRDEAKAPRGVAIVHRDEDLLVLVKPPGLAMHGGAGVGPGGSLLDRMRDAVVAGFGLVHRLDRDTSGLVALVRGEEARARTAERFADPDGGVRKVYEAIVEGVPAATDGVVDAPLVPPPHGGRARVDAEAGKPARTRFQVVERFEGAARLRVELETGRTHQIRVHLAHIGHPLLVDPLYGHRSGWRLVDPRGRLDARLRRTPLHAAELELPHPRTGALLTFRAPLPGDMRYALEVLRVVAGRRHKET